MLFLYDNSSGPQISQPYRSTSLTGASNNLFYIEIVTVLLFASKRSIECFHSRGQHLCKFIGTKESVFIRKEFNSQRIGLGHQHGRRFIVLGHQYGRRDVM